MGAYWIKVAQTYHRNPKARAAGWWGKELFLYLLCVNGEVNEDGHLPAHYVAPDHIAYEWGNPGGASQVQDALDACERAGLIEQTADGVDILGYDSQWGKRLSGAERQRRYRERKRAAKLAESVTPIERKKDKKERKNSTPPSLRSGDGSGNENVTGKGIAPTVAPAAVPTHDANPPASKRATVPRQVAALAESTCEYFNRKCGELGIKRRAKPQTHHKRLHRLVRDGADPRKIRIVVAWALYGPEPWHKSEVLRPHLQLSTLLKTQCPRGGRTFWDYLERAEEWAAAQLGEEKLAAFLGGD